MPEKTLIENRGLSGQMIKSPLIIRKLEKAVAVRDSLLKRPASQCHACAICSDDPLDVAGAQEAMVDDWLLLRGDLQGKSKRCSWWAQCVWSLL